MVAVVVSAENSCHYCMLSHGAACRLRTKYPVLVDRLLTNYRRAELEPAERAMLDYAVKVATAAGPNILRAFALLPDHFSGWWAYFDDLMTGPAAVSSRLTKAQREMVAVVVSAENDCHY